MILLSCSAQTTSTANVSASEVLVAGMASSPTFLEHLRDGGLAVARVILVSCEPLDPSALPSRLRPPPFSVTPTPLRALPVTTEAPWLDPLLDSMLQRTLDWHVVLLKSLSFCGLQRLQSCMWSSDVVYLQRQIHAMWACVCAC